jgi:hypothetical protein
MSRYADVTHVDSSKRFAVLIEGDDGVDTVGVSPQGKEWERWADALPPKDRRTLEQLLATLGSNVKVTGPATMSRAQKAEFAALGRDETTSAVDNAVAAADGAPSP